MAEVAAAQAPPPDPSVFPAQWNMTDDVITDLLGAEERVDDFFAESLTDSMAQLVERRSVYRRIFPSAYASVAKNEFAVLWVRQEIASSCGRLPASSSADIVF